MDALKPTITENGITYVLHGDYYLPLIEGTQDGRPIGKYGRMRLDYLKEHRPVLYNNLICTGKLHDHLVEVNECCTRQHDLIVKQMAQKEGTEEKLKAKDQMRWVGLMNNYRNAAEEFILTEYIYK